MNPRRQRFRAAIVGITGYGRIHLQLANEWVEKGGLELTAAVVINPTEVAGPVASLKASGTRLYSSFDEMIAVEAGRIDLCLVPTGIAWHARMTLAALQAGMNVLVEKPLASSLEEVDAVSTEAERSQRFVAVGFQDIYLPSVQYLKEQLLTGVLGRLRSVRFLGLWPRPPAYFARNGWAGRVAVDGVPVLDSPLNNAFAHFVNLVLFFSGETFADSAAVNRIQAGLWRTNAIEMFDSAVVSATTVTGIELWMGVSHACVQTREPEIRVQGERGQLTWLHEKEYILEVEGRKAVHTALPSTETARRLMMQSVMDRLAGEPAFLCSVPIARRHAELITRLHASTNVQSLPGELRAMAEPGANARVLSVPGIESVLLEAFARGSIPTFASRLSP